jgi:hypothetical protein
MKSIAYPRAPPLASNYATFSLRNLAQTRIPARDELTHARLLWL